MTILTRKFDKIFLLKLSYKNSCVKFDTFSRRNGTLFFIKNEALRNESVNKYYKLLKIVLLVAKFLKDGFLMFF